MVCCGLLKRQPLNVLPLIVWALTDYSIGNNSQTIAVAEKLSRYYIVKNIVYNFFAELPNFIKRDTLIGVNKKESSILNKELPDVVVCTGRRLACVALYIKRLSKGRTFIINIKEWLKKPLFINILFFFKELLCVVAKAIHYTVKGAISVLLNFDVSCLNKCI